jgi:hypothetical protein
MDQLLAIQVDNKTFRRDVQVENRGGILARYGDGIEGMMDDHGSEVVTDEQWDTLKALKRHGLTLAIAPDGTLTVDHQPA